MAGTVREKKRKRAAAQLHEPEDMLTEDDENYNDSKTPSFGLHGSWVKSHFFLWKRMTQNVRFFY